MSDKNIAIIGRFEKAMDCLSSLSKEIDFHLQRVGFEDCIEGLKANKFDLVVFAEDQEGLASQVTNIKDLRTEYDLLPILVLSDRGDWKVLKSLFKVGITDFFAAPFDQDQIISTITNQSRIYGMTKKVFLMEENQKILSPFEGIVGISPKMQENFQMISAVAQSNATVLISGESGTGKELVAKAIHRRSKRTNKRFVDLNCGAIPRDLLENELFGHEKGAFTGAHKRYQGSFEVAHEGTLFLDEISEMDPLLQVKLLRVIQERNFMRIGGSERINVDVRILAATNRNLSEQIEKGQFREDLYYRLNVVNIVVPALRERREDIPLLAKHFLEYFAAKNDRIFMDIHPEALEALINYDWPGNVRELENTMERIVVLHNDTEVKLKYLPDNIQGVNRRISLNEITSRPTDNSSEEILTMDEVEKQTIERALLKFQGNISIAAKKLKIGQATLYRKIKKYHLQQLGRD